MPWLGNIVETMNHTSDPQGGDEPQDEEDEARSRSLQLGGGGIPGGAVFGKYTRFFSEVREEMRKVTWPTRKMVVTETIVVLAVLIFFTGLLTGLDWIFALGFNRFLFGK